MGAKGGTPLDILAQLTPLSSESPAPTALQGFDKCDCEKLKKRARAKYVGDAIKGQLRRIKSPLHGSYLRSLTCASALIQTDNVVTARYCNSRWCLVCSRIRTAKAINGYYEQINALDGLHFLTLTVPNVRAHLLKKTVEDMASTWRRIINKSLKKSRFKHEKINGVRKLEVTYNIGRGDYHPHYHVIIDKGDIARFVLEHWLERWPTASRLGQDVRAVALEGKSRESALLELFKYSTKFHSKITKDNGQEQTKISAFHLDRIFRAIQGKRTYQPFGDIKKVSEDVEELESEEIVSLQPKVTQHFWFEHDWWDIDGGAALSEYEPTDHDKHLKDAICLVQKVSINHLNNVQDDTFKKPAPRRNIQDGKRLNGRLDAKKRKPRNG